uniref:Uncharacterized protein n=2 Tax=Rhodosorus marinus TaxID=101924 RepID=A0A7S3A9Y7_9RHOD|mmetsp:Transcript_8651/g.38473  ORF Transcript_8651/g.38473 Transcript_8651/m.38473 type:complete len:734 (+) Transcript_8651:200-2401(+)
MAKDHRVKLDVWKRALREAKLDGNFVEMNKIYNNMGKYYDLLGEYEAALECHNEELKLSVQFGSNEDVAVACRRVGDMNKTLQNFPDAINAYFQQLETAEKHNLDREEQRAYAGLGDVYRVRGDKFTEKDSAEDAKESWEVSERYLRKSIECAQKLARSDPERLEMIQNATLNLGLVKSSRGEPRPAIELMADAMEIATKRQDSVAKYLVSYNMVIEYINLEDYEKALEYAEKGLKLSKLTGDEASEAISCFQLGEINAKLRRYCVSAEHYRRYEEICDPEQKEEARELCTVAAKRVAAESRVRKMLKKLENGEEVDSPKIRGQIARLYMELSDYESAADHIQIRLGLIQETEDGGWDAYTETLDELVNALLEAGKSQAALPYAVEWVERMKRCESLDGAADAFYGYGLVHEELKEVEQALDAFKSSYELSVRASDLHLQRRALSKLVELQMSVAGAGAASKYQELLDGLPVAVESSSTSNGEDGEVISIAESINEADAELSPPVVRKRRKAGSSVSPSEAQDGALFRSAHSDEDLRSRTRNQSPPAGSDLSDNEEVNLHRQINVSKQLSLDNVDPELDSVCPTGSKDWVIPSPTPTRRLWMPQTSRSTSSSHSASGRSSSTTRKSPTVAHPRGPIADWIVDEEDPQTIARKNLVGKLFQATLWQRCFSSRLLRKLCQRVAQRIFPRMLLRKFWRVFLALFQGLFQGLRDEVVEYPELSYCPTLSTVLWKLEY